MPQEIIACSEHQLHDRALVLGFHEAFPGAPYTAVQNIPLPPNLLNLFPLPSDCNIGVVADRAVCSGPLPAAILAAESGYRLRTVVGCGLRYADLWQASKRPSPPEPGLLTVFVPLPYSVSRSLEVLDVVARVALNRSATRWLVKAHPANRIADIKSAIPDEALARLSFADLPTRECIDAANVVVTSGSGTALEAVACGTPVVQVGSSTDLNLDALAWFENFATTCYSSEELAAELDRLAAFGPEEIEALRRRGAEVRAAWFSPVTAQAMRAFLADNLVAGLPAPAGDIRRSRAKKAALYGTSAT